MPVPRENQIAGQRADAKEIQIRLVRHFQGSIDHRIRFNQILDRSQPRMAGALRNDTFASKALAMARAIWLKSISIAS